MGVHNNNYVQLVFFMQTGWPLENRKKSEKLIYIHSLNLQLFKLSISNIQGEESFDCWCFDTNFRRVTCQPWLIIFLHWFISKRITTILTFVPPIRDLFFDKFLICYQFTIFKDTKPNIFFSIKREIKER